MSKYSIVTHKECDLIKPEFGLPFPQDALWGWGARAILKPSATVKPLDFLYDRQTTVWTNEPTAELKQEFIRWINASTNFLSRAFTDPEIWMSSGNREHEALRNINRVLRNQKGDDEYIGLVAEDPHGRLQLRASTLQSGGYAYICCWQEHPGDDHTDLWGNWFEVERGITEKLPTRNGTWTFDY